MKIFSECTETMAYYVGQLSEPERNELQVQWEKKFPNREVLQYLKWVIEMTKKGK